MARGPLGDYLMSYRFHLLDVDWTLGVPPFVLMPMAGFSAITMPEMTIETEEIIEGTYNFKHQVLTKANVGSITLSRGATMFNADFWRWITACLKGSVYSGNLVSYMADLAKAAAWAGNLPVSGKRRNLALIQLSGLSASGLIAATKQGDFIDRAKATAAMPAAGISAGLDALESLTQGYVDFGISSIPARVWMLFDALPTRYKPGSDFDASSSDISVQELEVTFERFEEFSLIP
jgi:phage tail-like protein